MQGSTELPAYLKPGIEVLLGRARGAGRTGYNNFSRESSTTGAEVNENGLSIFFTAGMNNYVMVQQPSWLLLERFQRSSQWPISVHAVTVCEVLKAASERSSRQLAPLC